MGDKEFTMENVQVEIDGMPLGKCSISCDANEQYAIMILLAIENELNIDTIPDKIS